MAGNLTKVTLPDKVIEFVYNSAGERIQQISGGVKTTYVFVGDDLVQELDGSDNLKVWYNPGIYQSSGSTDYYFKHDVQGSTIATGSEVATAGTFFYDAWGNTLPGSSSKRTPFGYIGASGYYSDDDTGLMKLGARYYDPTIGRFITKDPATDGLNWYAYAGNNPVMMVDPSGLADYKKWSDCSWGAGEYLLANTGALATNTAEFLLQPPDPNGGTLEQWAIALTPIGGEIAYNAGRAAEIATVASKAKLAPLATKAGQAIKGALNTLARPLANQRGAVINVFRGSEELTFDFTSHATQRMAERKISETVVKETIESGSKVLYKDRQSGLVHTGYYKGKYFVGTYGKGITTVMNDCSKKYITSLKRTMPK